MAANALPGVLHAIAQRRPTAHFRAGDDTAELKDPTAAAARSSISSCQIPLLNLSLLAGCSRKRICDTVKRSTGLGAIFFASMERPSAIATEQLPSA